MPEEGVKFAIVNSKDLGSNCWMAKRFVVGTRCGTVYRCRYPEKTACKAVEVEIAYLRERKLQLDKKIHDLMVSQKNEKEGGER